MYSSWYSRELIAVSRCIFSFTLMLTTVSLNTSFTVSFLFGFAIILRFLLFGKWPKSGPRLFNKSHHLLSCGIITASCLRNNYSTSLIIYFPWRKRGNQFGYQGLLSRYLWSPRRPSLGRTGTVEVKICCGVWGLEMLHCCCYLLLTSYFSRFCRRFFIQSQLKFGWNIG